MCLDLLSIDSKLRKYEASFEKDDDFFKKMADTESACFVIDENVLAIYGNTLLKDLPKERIIPLPIAEDYKNIETVCALYEKIMSFAPKRNMTLVSIGGGITQDVTGFVASSLYRGVKWIFVPTTLLAQVDSCIGGKTSLNFKHFKNLVGTFYPPTLIHIFPNFVKSLSKVDFYSGIGEMAKLHLMNGADDTKTFIDALPDIDKRNSQVLLQRTKNCLEIKKRYIEEDEFDTGLRNMLNYGHCFGHAVESATDFTVPHGQAVVLGMILANKVALKRGILSQDTEKFMYEKVLKPILKINVPDFDIDMTLQAMQQDKKNIGTNLALIMIDDDYHMLKVTDLTKEEAIDAIKSFKFNYLPPPPPTP